MWGEGGYAAGSIETIDLLLAKRGQRLTPLCGSEDKVQHERMN